MTTVGFSLKQCLVYDFWGMDLYVWLLILSLIEINSTDWSHTPVNMLFFHAKAQACCAATENCK